VREPEGLGDGNRLLQRSIRSNPHGLIGNLEIRESHSRSEVLLLEEFGRQYCSIHYKSRRTSVQSGPSIVLSVFRHRIANDDSWRKKHRRYSIRGPSRVHIAEIQPCVHSKKPLDPTSVARDAVSRRSSSTRLTKPLAKRRSTAILIEPGARFRPTPACPWGVDLCVLVNYRADYAVGRGEPAMALISRFSRF